MENSGKLEGDSTLGKLNSDRDSESMKFVIHDDRETVKHLKRLRKKNELSEIRLPTG